jgi:hypothetical protein
MDKSYSSSHLLLLAKLTRFPPSTQINSQCKMNTQRSTTGTNAAVSWFLQFHSKTEVWTTETIGPICSVPIL